MKKSMFAHGHRAVKAGLFCACLGFSIALITSGDFKAFALNVGSRQVSTNAVRRPTEFVTNNDLGPVLAGSFFTRQVLVRFGFGPHSFSLGGTKPTSETSVSKSGTVSGSAKPIDSGAGTAGEPFVDPFSIIATDNVQGTLPPAVLKDFFFTVVPQDNGALRFLDPAPFAGGTVQQVTLPVAVANQPYSFSVQVNGGFPPYTLAFADPAFLPDGFSFDFEKNILFGRPLVATEEGQPARFNLLLSDANRTTVLGQFSLVVLPGTINSDFVATSGDLRLDFGRENGRDSLSLSLLLNKSDLNRAGIRDVRDLTGLPLTLNFGGFEFPPDSKVTGATGPNEFNSTGTISFHKKRLVEGDPVPLPAPEEVNYEIKLDPVSGLLKIKIINIHLIAALGANFLRFEGQNQEFNRGPVVPMNIRIGDVFDKTDIVKFVYRRRGSLGRGSAQRNDVIAPSGIFLMNQISGDIQTVRTSATNTADRITLKMSGIARQPGGVPVLVRPTEFVTIFVNTLCLGQFPASSMAQKGDVLLFVNDDPTKGIRTLSINNRSGAIFIDTHQLDPLDLFGQDVVFAGVPLNFPITMTIGGTDPEVEPTFDGQSSVTLFRRGSKLRNK